MAAFMSISSIGHLVTAKLGRTIEVLLKIENHGDNRAGRGAADNITNLKLRECLNKVMDNAEILVATPVPEVPQGTSIPSGEPYEESEAEMADGEGAISQ